MDERTAAITTPPQPQQDCPLMKLPTELRIRIYDFALQHLFDAIYDKASTDEKQLNPVNRSHCDQGSFYSGALAFIHTNRILRHESLDTLASLTHAHMEYLSAECNRIRLEEVQRSTTAKSEQFNAYPSARSKDWTEELTLMRCFHQMMHISDVIRTIRFGRRPR